jgi:cell wall-associated NlpC family hydrolase
VQLAKFLDLQHILQKLWLTKSDGQSIMLPDASNPTNSYAVTEELTQYNDDIPVATVSVVNSRRFDSNIISYRTDEEGNIYGPEDFAVDGVDSYIFNSENNTVIKFTDGATSDVIDLNDVPAIRIAAETGVLYVLDSNLVVNIFSDDGESIVDISPFVGSEAIIDFTVNESTIYLTTAEGDSGKTYTIPVLESEGFPETSDIIETFEGRFLNNETTYKVKLLLEDGYSIGHSCLLTVTNTINGQSDSIILNSEFWVVGAQLLGIDYENDFYVIKLFEAANNPDFTCSVNETIRTVNFQGELTGIRSLDKKVKSVSGQVKSYRSGIYELNSLAAEISINKLALPDEDSIITYSSPLTNVEPTFLQASQLSNSLSRTSSASAASISRATVISNAQAYYSSFYWTCNATNISAMTGYTKPRHISSAGTYTCMPYCWGGFTSTSEFAPGLNNGGRAGNINTNDFYVSNTYGVDCSGYVSRAWGLTSKRDTEKLPNISTAITRSELQAGDILNKAGTHVVLFDKYDSSGNYVVYEATKNNSYDRVVYNARTVSSLSDYLPWRYNNIY